MRRKIIVLVVLVLSSASFCLRADEPRTDCDDSGAHETGGGTGTPHTQGTSDPNEDDQCHGKPGDDGSCLIEDAAVNCVYIVKPSGTTEGCYGTGYCAGGGQVACGGNGWAAWAGVDAQTGIPYVVCKEIGTLNETYLSC